MGSYGGGGHGGVDEEMEELKRLEVSMAADPDNYEIWEKMVRSAESLEGGLTRNSSPLAITTSRDVYDRFLAKFPLFFGYWKKYADLEFSIAGTEAAELIYERGVASITNSVDLWAQYCAFKVETSHDPQVIRELFERGASCVGYDFLAHPFWDKYIEFEERFERKDNVFALYQRIVHIPMHQYARYFERFRPAVSTDPLFGVSPTLFAEFEAAIRADAGPAENETAIRAAIHARCDAYHLEMFQQCQNEVGTRWTYEQEIKRPYFHVTELDDAQLTNWRKYLDFEEAKGDYTRIVFLYERCIVAAAYYDEFWIRYARWMYGQAGKVEETRNIYQRASCIFAPIARPTARLQWALFEEVNGRVDVALDIYQAMLVATPGSQEPIIAWANCARRHHGVEAAINVYTTQVASDDTSTATKAALVTEWARLLWKVNGSAEEARKLFQTNQQKYAESRTFWTTYLTFELDQPTSAKTEESQYARIKDVFFGICKQSKLSEQTIKDLAQVYMVYLLERGTKDAAKEYMELDRDLNGSGVTVQTQDTAMSG